MSHEFRFRIPALPMLALATLVACGGGTVTDTPGPGTTPVDTTKPPATVQRASVIVRVEIDPIDIALAQQAGISVAGVKPAARIDRVPWTHRVGRSASAIAEQVTALPS